METEISHDEFCQTVRERLDELVRIYTKRHKEDTERIARIYKLVLGHDELTLDKIVVKTVDFLLAVIEEHGHVKDVIVNSRNIGCGGPDPNILDPITADYMQWRQEVITEIYRQARRIPTWADVFGPKEKDED